MAKSNPNPSIPGTKDAKAIIKRFHAFLNSSKLVPEQCYRMSSTYYALISYVNHIEGLFASKNYEAIPIFIRRAHKELERVPAEPSTKEYCDIARSYVCHMAHFLSEFTNVSDENIKSFIPSEILSAKLTLPRILENGAK